MTTHSNFGGSKAERWLNCPGSVALCASVPPLPTSAYALEGTQAHALAAYCLSSNCFDAAAVDGVGFIPPTDMIDAVQVYLDAVKNELRGAALYVEQRFDFPTDDAEV